MSEFKRDLSLSSLASFFNYLGQLRIYSLIDLVFLLIALKVSLYVFIGILFLHIGFILYLEHQHNHTYRLRFPSFLWIVLIITGILIIWKMEVLGFLIASYLYTKKKDSSFAPFSPFFRGAQLFFLVAGVIGYLHILTWLAFGATLTRNAAGDLRDVEKDRKEHLRTFPVILGIKRNLSHVHLIGLLLTTILWWSFTDISLLYLIIGLLLEVLTYHLTPR